MYNYLVEIYGHLFTVHRIVRADSTADAAAQVNQTGAVWMRVTLVADGWE